MDNSVLEPSHKVFDTKKESYLLYQIQEKCFLRKFDLLFVYEPVQIELKNLIEQFSKIDFFNKHSKMKTKHLRQKINNIYSKQFCCELPSTLFWYAFIHLEKFNGNTYTIHRINNPIIYEINNFMKSCQIKIPLNNKQPIDYGNKTPYNYTKVNIKKKKLYLIGCLIINQ